MKKPDFNQRVGRLLVTAVLVASSVLAGCVDNDYDFDNISPEVTIGGEEIVLPLGFIDRMKLSELISLDEIDGLNADSGVYVYSLSGEERSYEIGELGIPVVQIAPEDIDPVTIKSSGSLPTTFEMDRSTSDFDFDYPDLSVEPQFPDVRVRETVHTDIPTGEIPEGMSVQTAVTSGTATFDATVTVPAQIRSLGKLYYQEGNRSSARNEFGSPVNIALNLNDIYGIGEDVKVSFTVEFPENYELYDANGRALATRNVYRVEEYETGDEMSANFVVWLHSTDLSQTAANGGVYTIADEIKYDCTFEFRPMAGGVYNGTEPEFRMSLSPVYRDVEVVTENIVVDDEPTTSEVTYLFDGIPNSVGTVDEIAFIEGNAPVVLSMSGLEWLNGDVTTMTLVFSDEFDFSRDPEGLYDPATRTLTAPIGRMREGVTLNLSKIVTGENNKVVGGQLNIIGEITSKVNDIPAGTNALLSELTAPAPSVTVTTTIDGDICYIDFENSIFTAEENRYEFDMSEGRSFKLDKWVELPEQIKRVDKLYFVSSQTQGEVKATVKMRLAEGSTFPVDNADIDFYINFKKMIKPVVAEKIGNGKIEDRFGNGDNWYTVTALPWSPKETPELTIADLVIADVTNLPRPEYNRETGKWGMHLKEIYGASGEVHIAEGERLDGMWNGTQIEFIVEIDDLKVNELDGILDIDETISDTEFELDLPDDLDLTINDLAISPVIRLSATNPFKVPIYADLMLTPYDEEGEVIAGNTVPIEGVVIDGVRDIVLSTAVRRAEFAGGDVVFVEADVDNLLRGQLPAKIALDANIYTDSETVSTVDLSHDTYEVVYSYNVDIPLEFENTLDIVYNREIERDTTEKLPDVIEGVSFKSAGILADFETSIPVDLGVDVELLDAEGEPLAIGFNVGDGVVRGHNPASASETTRSSIYIDLDLGGGSLAQLNDLATVKFRLRLTSPAKNEEGTVLCPIAPDQTIEARLKLKIEGGITADLGSVLDNLKGGETECE